VLVQGLLATGALGGFTPCTALAVMQLVDRWLEAAVEAALEASVFCAGVEWRWRAPWLSSLAGRVE
jgi:hypothetical protein